MSNSNAPPPKAKVLPSPYPEPLQHFRAFRGLIDNFGIVLSRLRTSSSPSWQVIRAFNEFLKISGIEPSWLRTSFSPSPANANDSEEEPNIRDSETLTLDLEQFENVYSLIVRLTDDGGHSVMESLHSVSYDDLMPFMPLNDSYIQFGDGDEQYYISIYRPIATFRVAPQKIVILQYEVEMILGSHGKFSMERSNFVSLWVAIKATVKCRIPKQLDVPVRKKQKQTSDTSSSTGRKRAVLDIPLEMITPHYDKTLEQAAEAIKICESTLKNTVKYHGYKSWTDFKFKVRNASSKKATHSSLTTTLHGGDGSNTSGLPVLNPSDQSIPVVLEAANVDQAAAAYSVNATMFSSRPHEISTQPIQAYGGTQPGFPPQNQLITTFQPETSSVGLSHGGVISNRIGLAFSNPSDQHNLSMPFQAGNVNYSDAAYAVNATMFPSQSHEMPMQQIQACGGTQFAGFPPQNQLVTTFRPETSSVSLSHGGVISNSIGLAFSNPSDQHNLSMPFQAGNVNYSNEAYAVNATMFPSQRHEIIMQQTQGYGGTNDLSGFQPQNQSVTMSLPETTMQDYSAAVIVKARFGETNITFELFPWSKMEDLNRGVMKSLNLGVGSFRLEYLNKEGDWIPIGCDADWEVCMDTSRSLNRTAINMLVSLTDAGVDDYLSSIIEESNN